jgi:hypothetical protein
MNKLIPTLSLIGSSLLGQVTPNVEHNTPVWANENDVEVARVIMGEGWGEGTFGQDLIADNIRTRMVVDDMDHFEVVTNCKPVKQYHGYRDDVEPTDHVWHLVRKLKLKMDIIKNVDFYFFKRFNTGGDVLYKDCLVYKNHIHYNLNEGK